MVSFARRLEATTAYIESIVFSEAAPSIKSLCSASVLVLVSTSVLPQRQHPASVDIGGGTIAMPFKMGSSAERTLMLRDRVWLHGIFCKPVLARNGKRVFIRENLLARADICLRCSWICARLVRTYIHLKAYHLVYSCSSYTL